MSADYSVCQRNYTVLSGLPPPFCANTGTARFHKRDATTNHKRQAMKLTRHQFLHLAAGAAALIGVTETALAQNWPIRPITIVEPVGASSVPDVLVRIMAPRLSELLGQPVIVENVSGAGGMIGVSSLAKDSPDGYDSVVVMGGTIAYNEKVTKTQLYKD